ncbi:hypothetical protein [Pseudomonas oleovorans]|uniref:Uncharacterized protein n=1 Tax=Ectopseudomonas oleovorans TaxID=301 RepID=A0AA42QBD6_ECTOL|nr:hypothetical protein [Pseudomonas oleovorans]MDH1340610.1 hypothetical protein [Pseudomonas oleovorans]MDH1491582.1 hypothetical protein [Pseudomonas oleovorans]WGG22457.1 hypothetical protein N5O83_07235 [Pseudomonas oleovorans]
MTTAERGAGVYAISVLISENGYPHDSELLEGYARELSLGVLMANHSSPSGAGSAQDAARSGRPVGDRW